MRVYGQLVITLLAGFFLAMIFYFIMDAGSDRYHVARKEKMKEIFRDSTAYDILLLGSSRMHVNVDPRVVDSVTGLNSYNAGEDGAVIYEFKKIFDGYLVNHPAPSIVVLSLDGHSLDSRKKLFLPLQYFDFLDNRIVAATLRELQDYKMLFVRDLPFMRTIYFDDYSKKAAISGLFNEQEIENSEKVVYKGYLANGYACADTIISYASNQTSAVLQPEGMDMLRAIIDTCKVRNIRLMLTYAPEYKFRFQESVSDFQVFVNSVDRIAREAGIPFYRDDSLSLCNDRCLFANYGHLNTMGAIEYSKILGNRILALKKYLKK